MTNFILRFYHGKAKNIISLAAVGLVTLAIMLWFFWISVLPTTQRIVPQTGEPATFLIVYFWLIAIALIIALPLLYYMLFIRRAKMQNIFLASAFTFGILLMFVYLPFAYYDETHAHIPGTFQRASRLLGEFSIVDVNTHGRRIGYWRHHEDWWHPSYSEWWQPASAIAHPFVRYQSGLRGYYFVYDNFFSLNSRELSESRIVSARMWGQWYQYSPQVFGVAFAKLLGLGSVATLFMGRLFALAAFIGIVYRGISICNKKFKTMFVLLGLTPIALVSAASFSYDTLMMSMGFLFIAMVLNIAFFQEEHISASQLFILLVLSAFIAPYKYIYLPLLFLPIIIPKERFYRNEKVFTIACIIAMGVITFSVSGGAFGAIMNIFDNVVQDSPVQAGGRSTLLDYLGDNPQRFFAVFTQTFFYQAGNIFIQLRNWEPPPWAWQWPDIRFPIWIHIIAGFMLLASVSPSAHDENLALIKPKHRITMIAIVVAIYSVAIVATMGWRGQGLFVVGTYLQPRYFVPIIPLFVMPFYNVLKRVKANDRLLIFIMCAINAYAVIYYFTHNTFAN